MPRMVSGELKKEEDAKGVFKMPPFTVVRNLCNRRFPAKKRKGKEGKVIFEC